MTPFGIALNWSVVRNQDLTNFVRQFWKPVYRHGENGIGFESEIPQVDQIRCLAWVKDKGNEIVMPVASLGIQPKSRDS